MALLNVTTKIIAYLDTISSSNPRLKAVDWYRDIPGQVIFNPKSDCYTIPAGSSQTFFDGTISSPIDNTTTFSISLSTFDSTRYRITYTGGTNPVFKTGRNVDLNGISTTFAVNPNQTVTVTAASGTPFASVVVGDWVFIPHTTTGDGPSPISVLNAGFWNVLGKTSSLSITLVRPVGTDFEGVDQVVTPTAASQFSAFSDAGLHVGDSVDISSGFALVTRKTFKVVAVTDTFVEIRSTLALPSETGIQPGASGFAMFSGNKRFVYIESNQECAVKANGDITNGQRISPSDASDSNSVGQYMRSGSTWSLTVVNLSPVVATVTAIYSE